MLGMNEGFRPRFLKKYAELAASIRAATGRYADEVRSGAFPAAEHSTSAFDATEGGAVIYGVNTEKPTTH
jgi:ketopantoate hydroxymethyltransferase